MHAHRRRRFAEKFFRLHQRHVWRTWELLGTTLLGTALIAGIAFYRWTFNEWGGPYMIVAYVTGVGVLFRNVVRFTSLPTILTATLASTPAAFFLFDRNPMMGGIVAASALACFVLTAICAPASIADVLRVRVVPYFERPVDGPGAFCAGKALVWNSASLDEIARQIGVAPISDFSSGDDLCADAGEKLVWYDSALASDTVSQLLGRLRAEPNLLEEMDGVVSDLEKLDGTLQDAVAKGVRFCLLIREGSTCSGHEMGLRKGCF